VAVLIIILLSLALDTLAVAIGLGLAGLPRSRWLRVGVTFALFEGLAPIAGLLIGRHLIGFLGTMAVYVAGGILVLLGLMEIRETISDDDDDDRESALKSVEGRRLLLTGLSVSLDELAIGFSIGILKAPVAAAVAYIAGQAFVATFVGLFVGRRLGEKLGERAELAAGIVLLLLGIALVVEQAAGWHVL